MTPLQFAKEQCANYRADGGCTGIGIKDDGSVFMFGAKPACVLSMNQPCNYFEKCVLPMDIEACNARNIIRRKEVEEVRKVYRKTTGAMVVGGISKTARVCPQCSKRELEKHKRICYQCAKENQIKANRDR